MIMKGSDSRGQSSGTRGPRVEHELRICQDGMAARGRRRRRGRRVDPHAFERQLEEQRRRQQAAGEGGGVKTKGGDGEEKIEEPVVNSEEAGMDAGPASSPCAAPPSSLAISDNGYRPGLRRGRQPVIRGYYFDEGCGRYFRLEQSSLRGSLPSRQARIPPEKPSPPPRTPQLSRGPPQNIYRRLRLREGQRGRRFHMGDLGGLLRLSAAGAVLGQDSTLEDVDVMRGWVATGARNGTLCLSHLSQGEHFQTGILSLASSITRVRWRDDRRWGQSHALPGLLAVAETGASAGSGGGAAAVTVCALRGESYDGSTLEECTALASTRFLLGSRDLWGVEWDHVAGRRLLPGLSPGPLVVLDLEARRQLRHPFSLASDCFASHWSPGGAEDRPVFLGLRNGQVQRVDLRSGATSSRPLTRMGCLVDQLELLHDERRLAVSDRLGAIRLLDLRFATSRGLCDIPPTSSRPASTGFVLDPHDGTLCMTMTPDGSLLSYDLKASEPGEQGGRAHLLGSLTAHAPSSHPAPPRHFLSRRWECSVGFGALPAQEIPGVFDNQDKDALLPILVSGDRTSGKLMRLRLQREDGDCPRERHE